MGTQKCSIENFQRYEMTQERELEYTTGDFFFSFFLSNSTYQTENWISMDWNVVLRIPGSVVYMFNNSLSVLKLTEGNMTP